MPTSQQPLQIRFCSHGPRSSFPWREDQNSKWRVWRSNWPSDNFETVTREQLDGVELTCKILGIPFIDYDWTQSGD